MKQSTMPMIWAATIATAALIALFVSAADSPTKQQEELMQRERDIAQAFLHKDAKTVANWEADEYVYTDYDGTFYDKAKADDLAALKADTLTYTQMDVDNLKAIVLGDFGVVVGRVTQKGTFQGHDISGVLRFTDTYVKRDGRWQCVASQGTLIEKP